jgi:hypothetical protein
MELTNRKAIPFIYTVTASLANTIGASAQTTLIFQADSYFELVGFLASTNQTTESTDVSPNHFSVFIRDQTTGNDLMSNQVPQRVLCGNAFNGFLQKRGILFEPQSNLFFDFRNLVAVANTVTLTLHGYKLKI